VLGKRVRERRLVGRVSVAVQPLGSAHVEDGVVEPCVSQRQLQQPRERRLGREGGTDVERQQSAARGPRERLGRGSLPDAGRPFEHETQRRLLGTQPLGEAGQDAGGLGCEVELVERRLGDDQAAHAVEAAVRAVVPE